MCSNALQMVKRTYWCDKADHELDFVLPVKGQPPTVIACKWKSTKFDSKNLRIFRRHYPGGQNFVVASDVSTPYRKTLDSLDIRFLNVNQLDQLAI